MNQSSDLDLRILKIKSCSSRTGQSILTYHIGCNEDSELFFRIHGNSGNGFFNENWVSLNDIESALAGPHFTSYALKQVYSRAPVERRVHIAYLLKANAEGKPSGTRCVPYMGFMG